MGLPDIILLLVIPVLVTTSAMQRCINTDITFQLVTGYVFQYTHSIIHTQVRLVFLFLTPKMCPTIRPEAVAACALSQDRGSWVV